MGGRQVVALLEGKRKQVGLIWFNANTCLLSHSTYFQRSPLPLPLWWRRKGRHKQRICKWCSGIHSHISCCRVNLHSQRPIWKKTDKDSEIRRRVVFISRCDVQVVLSAFLFIAMHLWWWVTSEWWLICLTMDSRITSCYHHWPLKSWLNQTPASYYSLFYVSIDQ